MQNAALDDITFYVTENKESSSYKTFYERLRILGEGASLAVQLDVLNIRWMTAEEREKREENKARWKQDRKRKKSKETARKRKG